MGGEEDSESDRGDQEARTDGGEDDSESDGGEENARSDKDDKVVVVDNGAAKIESNKDRKKEKAEMKKKRNIMTTQEKRGRKPWNPNVCTH